jgi:hypothetical protein
MKHRSLREGDAYSAPLCEGDDVVQLFRSGFKEAPQIAGRLTDSLLVFHQCDAHKPFPVLAKTAPRSDREVGLFDQ